jgi:hypothetical protein
MLNHTDLAYFAGLLDALARLRTIRSSDRTRLPVVAISSPNLGLLHHCARQTGVKVTAVNRDYLRLGCDQHCTERHLHVASSTGRWQVAGARATVVLFACLPFLVDLHDDAEHLLRLGLTAPKKPQTVAAMRRLGWPALPAREDAA